MRPLRSNGGTARPAGRSVNLLVALLAFLATGCAAIVELEAGDPVEFVQQPQTSQIFAADGTVLAELHAEQDRQDVSLDDVPAQLVAAVVSVEDRRFFLHAGVDLAAIVRAAVRNIELGDLTQGGSTITQQYVKNTMTGPARTLDRKLREAALAFQLEQRYTKHEILERYLNTIYFGQGAYGVHAAAERFFAKDLADLELHEAALLAGLIAGPSRFDPYHNPDAAIERRRVVLDAMVSTGQIGRDEAQAAGDARLGLAPPRTDQRLFAPYFVEEVKRVLQHDLTGQFSAVLGESLDDRVTALFTGGLRIHTTVDPTWQRQAEAAVASVLTEDDDPAAGLVALDPLTGAVRALVGGRDFYDRGDPHARFNLATQGQRQPGSAFKPIVLATALSRGISMDRVFPGGACVEFPQLRWEPCNYGNTDYAAMTLREATIRSVNTVYARLAVEMGPTPILQLARSMGFRGQLDQAHALALGSGSVSPFEMAGAYATFATLGTYRIPYLVERIETADGEVLYEHVDEPFRLVDEAVAYVVTQSLSDAVRRGTGVRAQIGRPQAGKTGTSQRHADAWFVGYTPDLVAAVWVGFPEAQIPLEPPNTRIRVEGGRWPAEIWQAFATEALSDTPETPFPVPDVDLVLVRVDGTRNCLPNPYTPPELVEEREYLSGTQPTERCTEPTGPPIDDVPGVIGLPVEVARRLLESQGFVLDLRPEASRLYPTGYVTRQRPGAGGTTLERDGNAVVLWVSTAVRTRADVPDVVGMEVLDAILLLEAAGWVVEARADCPVDGCPEGSRPGTVWGQSPEGGVSERQHSAVMIRVVPEARDS